MTRWPDFFPEVAYRRWFFQPCLRSKTCISPIRCR